MDQRRFPLALPRRFLGAPQNPRILWGEEEGMERAEFSPKGETEQSGISSDEMRRARWKREKDGDATGDGRRAWGALLKYE